MSRKLLRALKSRSRKTPRSSASLMQHFKPALEPLEQRTLLSATVFNHWDFENQAVGAYTDAQLLADFDPSPYDNNDDGAYDQDGGFLQINDSAIVSDTINGVSTKVLRLTHFADETSSGIQLWADLGADRNEIYLSYNFKPSADVGHEYVWNEGGKLLGLGAGPVFHHVVGYPLDNEGFNYLSMFHQGGTIATYNYDEGGGSRWGTQDYNYCDIYLNNGNWYNITQRVVVNTFTNGVANADGINEYWVDGRMIFRETGLKCLHDERADMKLDELLFTNFYGGNAQPWWPPHECYGYVDNISVWLPDAGSDATVGTHNSHAAGDILPTPDPIFTNRTLVYDTLVTQSGATVQNSQYNLAAHAVYSPGLDETYLIDAGPDKKVSYSYVIQNINGWEHLGLGRNDFFVILDGNRTDSPALAYVDGANTSAGSGTVTSTGRYMTVRLSTDKFWRETPPGSGTYVYDAWYDSGTGFTGTATFVSAGDELPPGNLLATPASTTQINLAWSDNSSAETSYQISRATNSAFTSNLVTTTAAANATSYASTGLTEGTTYYYRVRASNGAASVYSNTATAAAIPTAPGSLSATAISAARVALTWTDNSGNETGYEIDRATNSSFTSGLTTFSVGPNVTSYQSTGLTQGTTYYYRVRATDSFGAVDSANSSSANATTSAGGTLTVTSTAAEDGYIIENADTGTGATAYPDAFFQGTMVMLVGDASNNSQYKGIVSFDTSALPDTATITAATLRLRRSPLAGNNNPFDWGGELRVDIKGGTGFGNAAALAAADFQNAADATDVADVSNPLVDGDGKWAQGVISGSGMSYINKGTGRTQFRVYFQTDDNNDSSADNISFFTPSTATNLRPELVIEYTTGVSTPAAPSNLGATAASTSQINLSWTDNSGNETAFEIDRATNSAFTSGLTTATVTSNVTTYSSTGLTEGTTYYYRVRSTNAQGDSANCNTATTAAMPSTPTGLGATTASSSQINLAWTDVSGHESAYEIDRATSSDFSAGLTTATVNSNVTSYASTGLSASTTYYYRVRATVGGTVDSANSATANATTSGGGGSSLTVYSVAADDGYTYESGENTNVGGGYNATVTDLGLIAGDASSPTNAQFKSILSFDTSALPDDATVTSATLRMRRSNQSGQNPFAWAGSPELRVDIKSGSGFGDNVALAAADFQNAADATNVAHLSNPAADGDWSTGALSSGLSNINKTGKTQFKVYFSIDDDNDGSGDQLKFYSGGSASGYQPELVLVYTTGSTPTVPSGLGATAASTSQINLSWTDNSGDETAFEIDRATNSDFSAGLTTATVTSNVTTYASTGLTEGTTYYYRVRSTNANGDSANSSTATTAALPSTPTGLDATVASSSQINLAWTDASGHETAYEIDRATNSDFSAGLTTATVSSNVTSYQSTGLAAGTTYYYRVRATVGGTVDSANSNTDSATTDSLPSPWVTGDVGAVGATGTASYSSGTFTVEGSGYWIYDTADEFRYVYQQVSGDCSIVARVTSIENVNDWSQAGVMIRETLDTGSKQAISLIAYNQTVQFIRRTSTDGSSAYTNQSSYTTPYWLKMERAGSTFTASRSDNGSSWTTIGSESITMNSSVYIGLAMCSHLDGTLGTGVFDNVTVTAGSAPAAPSGLGATAASTSQINLSWTDNSGDETAFEIDRATNSDFSAGLTTATVNSNVTTYASTGLTEGTTYYYRVRSTNASGDSANSSTATTAAMPSTPTGLGATTASSSQINLAWTDASGHETAYEIDRATNSDFSAGLTTATVSSNVTSYSSTGLTNNTTYYYRVRATIGGSNDSANSTTANATAGLPSPWATGDIGAVGATGTAAYDVNGTFTIEGSGEWIYSTADEFRYVYQQASGDCSIIARVTSIEDVAADDWSQAGVMIRETLDAGSKHGLSVIAYNQTVQFLRRTTTNGSTAYTNQSSYATPYWLKMERVGNTLTASRSANGSSWTQIGSETITMGTNVYIGLAVNSNEDGQLCTATFDNVSVSAMRAADGEMVGREVEALTQEALDPVAAAAMARWEAVLRATTVVNARVSNNAFAGVEFVITDLAGDQLGMTVGSTIYLDDDAAGYGWYTDALFAKNLNFLDKKDGVGMDLLTVVSHELGHVLGLGHAQRGVMSETLDEGVRMLPSWSDLHSSSAIRGRALAAALDGFLDADVDVRHEFLKRV